MKSMDIHRSEYIAKLENKLEDIYEVVFNSSQDQSYANKLHIIKKMLQQYMEE